MSSQYSENNLVSLNCKLRFEDESILKDVLSEQAFDSTAIITIQKDGNLFVAFKSVEKETSKNKSEIKYTPVEKNGVCCIKVENPNARDIFGDYEQTTTEISFDDFIFILKDCILRTKQQSKLKQTIN